VLDMTILLKFSSARPPFVMLVSIKPGAIAFTLIFNGAKSWADALVRFDTPPLAALYAIVPGIPTNPKIDDMLIMDPAVLVAFIALAAALIP